jgi:hypothetical protein
VSIFKPTLWLNTYFLNLVNIICNGAKYSKIISLDFKLIRIEMVSYKHSVLGGSGIWILKLMNIIY